MMKYLQIDINMRPIKMVRHVTEYNFGTLRWSSAITTPTTVPKVMINMI